MTVDQQSVNETNKCLLTNDFIIYKVKIKEKE